MDEADLAGRETELLIRRCQNGDQLATGALIRRYQNFVFRLCYLIMRNEQDAEDMTQETFIRAFRALPRFQIRQGVSFEAWLYRIAVNRCRSRMRRKWYQVLPWPTSAVRVASPEPQPDWQLMQSEQRSEILDAISLLSQKHRLVVILRYYAGLSNTEIAKVLQIPPGTVRSRLHSARQRLKKLLDDEEKRTDRRIMPRRVAQ